MKKILLLGLIVLSNHLYSQSIMSEKKFTDYVTEKINQSFKKITTKAIDDLFLYSYSNNLGSFMRLEDSYSDYKNDPQKLNDLLQKLLSEIDATYTPDPNYKIDTTQIVPIVKSKEYIRKVWADNLDEIVFRDFLEDLVIIYVEDKKKGDLGYRFFSTDELSRTDINKDDLNDLSLQNLKRILPDVSSVTSAWKNHEIKYYDGFEGDEYGSKYMASLILFPDFLNQETDRLQDNLIISIPTENYILVLDENNESSIEKFKELSIFLEETGNISSITKKLFLWNGKELKPL